MNGIVFELLLMCYY